MDFAKRLHKRILETNSRVCLGIDPRPFAHPSTHPDQFEGDNAQVAKAVVNYFREIIEATQDLVACYKPQSAFFEAMGIPGLVGLAQLMADIKSLGIPVILDAKRGDIGSTAEAYAGAYLTNTVFAADALTVNPYLGMDALEPFIQAAQANERGLFVLVKTSNPGSHDFQGLETLENMYVYDHVAYQIAGVNRQLTQGSYGPVGAVIGATHPEELEHLREVMPQSIILVPGYGAQGGGADDVVAAFDEEGLGAVVSSSRSLSYFNDPDETAARARAATEQMRHEINEAIGLL
ncbi:MAG: orotidine-5'-phosphate decarboxylase [Trueperaceae bacterium]|nr:orotidine-5'-phosphate decarboxylase [Trueperaceae bacterium]